MSSLINSFILAIRVPIGIVVAFWLAWLLVRVDVPGRRFIMYALWFTFFLPILPLTLGWILLAHANYGLINEVLVNLPFVSGFVVIIRSMPGILWVHLTLATIPIMTLLLAPALQQLDGSFEEASDVAGARIGTTLRIVTAPLILPAILTAFVAGLIRALEVFEVEALLGDTVRDFRLLDAHRRFVACHSSTDQVAGEQLNQWTGHVHTRAFLGEGVDHLILVNGFEMKVRTKPHISIPAAEDVTLHLEAAACHVVSS